MAEYTVPQWFDKRLLPLLEKKLDRSKMKKRERTLDWILRQNLKALSKHITGMVTKKFEWGDIERIIEQTCEVVTVSNYQPDAIIGIKSGGAFIANYVAQCLQVPTVDYMRVTHYSANSQSIVKATLENMNKQAVVREEPAYEVKGKKILLVDDQAATGSSLLVAKNYLEEKEAEDVRTFILYGRRGKGKGFEIADYCVKKGLMVYTPWGKDA